MRVYKYGGLIFGLVFAWRIGLFLLSAQPIPANDSFFYDGAVVNYILHGDYFNPSLAVVFPINGSQFFSAYPPMYQAVLLAWMKLFGVSALSAMVLHLALMGLYMLGLLSVLRQLRMPDWCVSIAGLFLFLITFNDRPDVLSHVFGMLAVSCWLKSLPTAPEASEARPSAAWAWLMAAAAFLSLCTSLQIGGAYYGILFVCAGASFICRRTRLPIGAMLTMIVVPIVLVGAVRLWMPLAWAGFREHVHNTPSVTGLRAPSILDLAKLARTLPGVILVLALIPCVFVKYRKELAEAVERPHGTLLLAGVMAASGVIFAGMVALTADLVTTVVDYLQPLIVAAFLAIAGSAFAQARSRRWLLGIFALAVLAGSSRTIGMSTWGLACARDVSYSSAILRVRQELDRPPPGGVFVVSSAYLYEAFQHTNTQSLHSDWLAPAGMGSALESAMRTVKLRKPREMILTQFDYYRNLKPVLEKLASDPAVLSIQTQNTSRIAVPDSSSSLQRIVQHIAWAPVIVSLTWR